MSAKHAIVMSAGLALGAVGAFFPTSARGDAGAAAHPGPGPRAEIAARRHLARQIHAHVAARMPDAGPEVHGKLARTIVAEATRAGVDPLLVVALIHTESSFDPEAVSSAGAVGLMQLREPTMRSEAARSGLPSADPRDPVASVQAGVRYLHRLLEAFGQLDVALMAYNAGPNRIVGHLRQGSIPERFHAYPRKVKAELERLRQALAPSTEPPRA